jgi:RNA polymerase sigma-70 factor (ECF subfamily)
MIQQRGLISDLPASLAVADPPGIIGLDEFKTIYDSCAVDCYRLARHVVRDAHLAQDVVQNVFAAFWRGDARFDPARGSVRSWLLTVTHFKAVDLVRSNQRHSAPTLTEKDVGRLQAIDDVEELGLRGARTAHVALALGKLSAVQREVIMLSYYGGLSQTEIAVQTDTALGTVKTRMLHALKHLRRDLDLETLAVDEGWNRPRAAAVALAPTA